jgi:hypothetical protein
MIKPKGFMDNSQNACKLNKSTYGLRQISLLVVYLLQGF